MKVSCSPQRATVMSRGSRAAGSRTGTLLSLGRSSVLEPSLESEPPSPTPGQMSGLAMMSCPRPLLAGKRQVLRPVRVLNHNFQNLLGMSPHLTDARL